MCTWLVTMRDRSCRQGKNYNVHHESDLNYTLEMCRWLLKPLGVWTSIYHRVSKAERIVSLFLQLTCFSCLLFVILPSAQNMFFMEEDLQNIVKLFGPVGFCTFSAIKYCILGIKGNIFGRCIKHIEKDWKIVGNPYHRTIMLKQASISRYLITVCVAFLYTGGMCYHTVMQFLSKGRTNANVTVRPITYPCFDFLDTQSSPTYEIVFFLHCVSAFVQYTITSAGYSMAAIFVTHICGQIEIQITRLNELIDNDDEKCNFPDRIRSIIQDHAEPLKEMGTRRENLMQIMLKLSGIRCYGHSRFSKDVEEALCEVCFTEIIESTVIMCLLEYYCLMEWENSDTIAILTYVMLLVSFTFNIFIFCYVGEILSEQCSRMGPAVYEIQWYKLPPKNAYNLILLSAMALYPPKLTAGKIIDLSLSMFGTVVKTSVIYFNLLRTFATW